MLHGAFKDAVRCGDLPINPMTKVSRPKINATRILPVPQEDFVRIYGAAKSQPYWLALLEIAGIMGPRKGEYLALRWSDVNLENRVITLRSGVQREGGVGLVIGDRKNHDSHHFPISSKQVQILVAYREFQKSNKTQWSQDLDLLFPNSQGGIMDPRNFNRSWKKFLEVHGLPYYSPHRLRKTAHTNISQIADPGTLKSLSGHKSVTTTLSYYVMPGEESARAAVEKLDKFRGDEQIIDFQVAKATREKQMTTKNHESSGKNYA